jgi:hypothetical protein
MDTQSSGEDENDDSIIRAGTGPVGDRENPLFPYVWDCTRF